MTGFVEYYDLILPKLPSPFIGRRKFSGMEPYGKIDLARILPKPMPDIERTLAEGYTIEIMIDLADHKEEVVKKEPKDETDPEKEEEPESESDSEEELEPMISTWVLKSTQMTRGGRPEQNPSPSQMSTRDRWEATVYQAEAVAHAPGHPQRYKVEPQMEL